MNEHQRMLALAAAKRDAPEIADANIDGHPHAADGTAQHNTFPVQFHIAHAAVCANVVRIEADGQRERVEPQCAARPGRIDPARCLTPHGFVSTPGLCCPVDAQELARAVSEFA
jgi:hypothetical protein